MILPVEWKTSLKILAQDEINKIHKTSLNILNNTGMHMSLDKNRLDALSDFGLKVDRKIKKSIFLWLN